MPGNFTVPDVYAPEPDNNSSSIVPVATAVPAFIGYTPRAEQADKSCYNKPIRITSLEDFQAIFMLRDPPPPADPAKQYSPQFYIVEQTEGSAVDCLEMDGKYYCALPDPATIYYLYNSVRLFYLNGGADAYIVAVGGYGSASGKPSPTPRDQIVNPNVRLDDLLAGLALLKNEQEPTLYVCPEAPLLSLADNAVLMQAMLRQASEMQTAFCLFDVIGGDQTNSVPYARNIENFRNSVGTVGLNYGACYYPFVCTDITRESDIDFTNLFGADVKQLAPLLNPPSAPNSAAAKILAMIETPPTPPMLNSQLHRMLLGTSKTYKQIINHVLAEVNMLPTAGAMAGVYTANDSLRGVWSAPANVIVTGAVSLPIRLSDAQQADLNIDPISGKSINPIRFFNWDGIRVWGARTLDGNSPDWHYVSVRRTVTFIEQSIKSAARALQSEPNDKRTWDTLKRAVNNFLTDLWKLGGLMGSTAAGAFAVEVGLGSTMTDEDVARGVIRIVITAAISHPAEFMVITIEQKQAA